MKIIPVIHHINEKTTMLNAEICNKSNVYGVFVISMDGVNEDLANLARKIKLNFLNLMVGVNHLGYTAKERFFECLNYSLDMCWSDNNIVNSDTVQKEAFDIQEELRNIEFKFFNSVAFKYQKVDLNPALAALNSKQMGFIPTTSGVATGVAADLTKISLMKNALKDYPLAIASGLTVENILDFNPFINFGFNWNI